MVKPDSGDFSLKWFLFCAHLPILLCKCFKSYFEGRNIANSRLFFKKRSGQILVGQVTSSGIVLESIWVALQCPWTVLLHSISSWVPATHSGQVCSQTLLPDSYSVRVVGLRNWLSERFPQSIRKWPDCRLFTKAWEHRYSLVGDKLLPFCS